MKRPGFLDFIPITPSDWRGAYRQVWCALSHCKPMRGPRYAGNAVTRVTDHIGRRGSFLLVMGFLFIALGFAYRPDSTVAAPIEPQLHWITRAVPLAVFAVGWFVAGCYLCFVGAFRASGSQHRDGRAFIVGQAMPTMWAVVWGVSYFERHFDPHRVVAGHVSPGRVSDAPRGLVNFAIYITFSLLFLCVAGMIGARQVLDAIPENGPL